MQGESVGSLNAQAGRCAGAGSGKPKVSSKSALMRTQGANSRYLWVSKWVCSTSSHNGQLIENTCMGMITGLFNSLRRQATGRRHWTPSEVRELIDAGRLDEARVAIEQLSPQVPRHSAERACLQGELLFRQHLDAQAATAFQLALAEFPGMAAAHHGLSLILAEKEQLEDAVLHAQFAVEIDPTEPRYLAQVGYCHLRQDNFQAAEIPLRRATRQMANNPFLWNNLGLVLRAKGAGPEQGNACNTRFA